MIGNVLTTAALLAMATSCSLSEGAKPTAVVDRVEGKYAVVELTAGNKHEISIPATDINCGAKPGTAIPVTAAEGSFKGFHIGYDGEGSREVYYSFKSYDGTAWWDLTYAQMGFVPRFYTPYTLYTSNNGTTWENRTCGHPAEFECDCCYADDLFFAVEEVI